jgi:hypothetical protein
MEIFNRWGIMVYQAKGYDNSETAFRGISAGTGGLSIAKNTGLPSGVYYYVLQFEVDGRTYKRAGYISISNR